ncbi:unnamed protein product [Urochloa humidicola]
MEHEEESVVGDHEEDNGGGGDTVDEDSDEDMDGWDENGDPYQPFIAPWHRPHHKRAASPALLAPFLLSRLRRQEGEGRISAVPPDAFLIFVG